MGNIQSASTVDGQPNREERPAPKSGASFQNRSSLDSIGEFLLPEVRETLQAFAELAALALSASSAFIYLVNGGMVSYDLSSSEVTVAERLSDQCLRSAGRIVWQAGAAASGVEPNDQTWIVVTLVAGLNGKIVGTLGILGQTENLVQLSSNQERALKLLQDRISSRINVEEMLKESLAHYDHAMELDPFMRWTADAQGNLVNINGRWEELTGGPRERALGAAWREQVHSDDRSGALSAFSMSLRQGSPIDVKFRLHTASGEWRWTRTRARARRNLQGELLCWYGTTEDIHDQMVAEIALRESNAKLHTVFNQAMVGIIHRDADERVLMVNDRYCDLVGRSAAELDGLPMERFTNPQDVLWNKPLFAEHARTGESFQVEKRYLRPDGSSLWCEVHVSFVCDERGVPRSTIIVVQDIAARREAEDEVRESRNLLQTVIDSVSDLIFVRDESGGFVLANKAMREGCLQLSSEMSPDSFGSKIQDEYRESDARVMASGEALAFDELITMHSELRPYETIKVPWRKGDRIAGIIGVSRDMTERLRADAALRESEEHYRYSVELNPQVAWTASPDGEIEDLGSRWADFTGGEPNRARGRGWVEAIHPSDVSAVLDHWQRALKTHEPFDIEYRLRRIDRTNRWVRARAAPRFDEAGNVIRWYGTLENIDDHRRDQDALRKSEERFRLATQAAQLGIWDYDIEERTHEWSDEFRKILGLPSDAEASSENALSVVHPDDRQQVQVIADAAVLLGGDQRFELVFRIYRVGDGELRWLCANGWRTSNISGALSRVLVAVRDITEARTVDERIRWAARHDGLTRLPNRAAFQDALDVAMDRSERLMSQVGLLLVDVDHLKQTNDSLGHDAGDAVLRTIGDRLHALAGDKAFIARLGGDEFAVLFSGGSPADDMLRISTELGPVLAEAFAHNGRILDCRSTCGGSLFPKDGENGVELLKAADMALYAAKAEARGGIRMFRPEMRADLERRSSMISMARAAINDDRIIPFYQPKVELRSGKLVGFEALLRWHHPSAGLCLPGEILAAFDNLELALAISDRMFDQAIAHMRSWLDAGLEFGTIAINAASAEFRHDDLAERILERLERAGVPATRLELEVTETVFLGGGANHVNRALRTLSAAGVRIALDDFGTGYASLSHLKQYPVDTIKIDRSFVCDLENVVGDAAIVDAVINLGVSLGLAIVAEGIETQSQAHYLLKHGCEFGQGYLFGRASSPATIPSLISEWAPPYVSAWSAA